MSCGLVFLVFGTGKLQPFNGTGDVPEEAGKDNPAFEENEATKDAQSSKVWHELSGDFNQNQYFINLILCILCIYFYRIDCLIYLLLFTQK